MKAHRTGTFVQQLSSRNESFPHSDGLNCLALGYISLDGTVPQVTGFPLLFPSYLCWCPPRGARMCWEAPLPRVLPGDLRMARVGETVSLCCFVYKNIFAVIDV